LCHISPGSQFKRSAGAAHANFAVRLKGGRSRQIRFWPPAGCCDSYLLESNAIGHLQSNALPNHSVSFGEDKEIWYASSIGKYDYRFVICRGYACRDVFSGGLQWRS
jgi:hypothetical protein